MSVCKVVYHFENRSQPKVLDSDLYSYIDVIYDIYNSVLRHIPEEKSISFKVKCVMEDIDVEMEIDSDGKVQKMFQVNQQGSEFHLHVYDVNVFDEYPNVINGYSKTIMDRKGRFNMMGVNVDQNVGKRRIQKTLARRFVSEPRDKEATHVHEVQVVPISEPRVVVAVETVEQAVEISPQQMMQSGVIVVKKIGKIPLLKKIQRRQMLKKGKLLVMMKKRYTRTMMNLKGWSLMMKGK
ncbi:hypothetical protein NE237_005812 [Protea cynaroides]|uniref:Uncharacterized protein n=1 Tax=Protea cynaroides TaxID=273540 RepID=A0A9Q0KL42_9MAGN|nr:hypothetical protein NE237_005812 [Protea cynaroides]